MREIQISQKSNRSQALPSNQFQQEQINPPQQKSKMKYFTIIFFVILALTIWAIHYQNSKHKVLESPFQTQTESHTQKQPLTTKHDERCYTQGLSFINKTHLLQSCGLYGQSYFHILQYELNNEKPIKLKETFKSSIFQKDYFLEGSVYFPKNNLIYILTWKQKIAFAVDPTSLKTIKKLNWTYEGWGLTHNNTHLIVSDGSNRIFITNQQLQIQQIIEVHNHLGQSQNLINQLEWIQQNGNQYVYANIYTTSNIIKVDLKTGQIVKDISFQVLAEKQRKSNHREVMNGIAYHKQNNIFLLTGKKWGSFYQINHL